AGLVPPFSDFFYAILSHYRIHALHLQPISILVLAIFAFYCEAFVDVRPSVALFRHFFSLRFTVQDQRFACVSFVDVKDENICLKARNKVEGYRQRWVFMEARRVSLLLMTHAALSEQNPRWGHEKLDDPRAEPILERIAAHGDAKLTGAMIIKEFLGQRIAPLQAHS
uniref:Transposase (putative) gypsy type domain-containing protein n=1 Tax=Aegilops tauschii subsp. strangulata TaxID=200361 RepID=A0A453P9W4_AEGTS